MNDNSHLPAGTAGPASSGTAGFKLFAALAVVIFFVAGIPLAGFAQGEEGIVVQGSGVAKARPTQVEINGTITAEAELAADATVKFRDAKKRAMAAFAALKNPDLSIISSGVSVDSAADANTQMMMMRGMAVANVSQKVKITEASRITLVNTDKLEPEALLDKVLKILDVAKDAGFQVGPAPASNYWELQMRMQGMPQEGGIVAFKPPDSTAVRDKAYGAALDDARGKAQRLADLAGIKLGRIVSVQERTIADDNAAQAVYPWGFGAKTTEKDTAVSGTTSGDLALHVNLNVRFEIAK